MYRKLCLHREITKSALSESSDKKEETHLQLKDSSIVIISNVNRNEDIVGVVNKIVDGNCVKNGSSIYIVVTCSDNETDSNMDSNSTVCLQLSNVSNEFSTDLVPVNTVNTEQHKVPYGFKILTGCKDKRLDVQTRKIIEDPQKCLPNLGNCCKNEESPKKTMLSTTGPVNFNVAMDTTEDRPCCCCPEKADKIYINEYRSPCTSSNLSDVIIIPTMAKENESQGYRKGIIRVSESKYHASSKSVVLMTPPDSSPVPTKVCSIPPSRNPHHKATRAQMVSQSTTCVPQDLMSLIETIVKDRKKEASVCVDTQGLKFGVRIPWPKKQNVKEDMCTGQCGHVKINNRRTVKCQTDAPEKLVDLKCQCPSDMNSKEIRPRDTGSYGYSGELAGSAKGAQTTKKSCSCDEKKTETKKNRDIICQCPQPEYDEHFNDFEWVDDKEVRKMKSDLTQTTSGFTVDVVPRPLVRELTSFEDALEYYGVQESAPTVGRSDNACSCDDLVATTAGPSPPSSAGVDCKCPGEEQVNEGLGELESEVKQEIGQWPLQGIRLTISGKGSNSTGLVGLCCFDMTQEVDGPY